MSYFFTMRRGRNTGTRTGNPESLPPQPCPRSRPRVRVSQPWASSDQSSADTHRQLWLAASQNGLNCIIIGPLSPDRAPKLLSPLLSPWNYRVQCKVCSQVTDRVIAPRIPLNTEGLFLMHARQSKNVKRHQRRQKMKTNCSAQGEGIKKVVCEWPCSNWPMEHSFLLRSPEIKWAPTSIWCQKQVWYSFSKLG